MHKTRARILPRRKICVLLDSSPRLTRTSIILRIFLVTIDDISYIILMYTIDDRKSNIINLLTILYKSYDSHYLFVSFFHLTEEVVKFTTSIYRQKPATLIRSRFVFFSLWAGGGKHLPGRKVDWGHPWRAWVGLAPAKNRLLTFPPWGGGCGRGHGTIGEMKLYNPRPVTA